MSEIYDDGLTMDQASPDLNDGGAYDTEETEGYEFTDSAPQQTDNRSQTKRVSDRINAIRAENASQVEALQNTIEEQKREILRYRAIEEGVTEEELAERDRLEEESFKEALHNDPEFLELQQRDFERHKTEVLTRLQEEFPNDGIEDLDAMPPVFFRQLQAGVDPVSAYRASVYDSQRETPPSTGSVKSHGETTKGNISEDRALSMSTEEWVEWLNENET
jgi:hypothetical protein